MAVVFLFRQILCHLAKFVEQKKNNLCNFDPNENRFGHFVQLPKRHISTKQIRILVKIGNVIFVAQKWRPLGVLHHITG